jgi:type IV secretion system protein VirB9
MTGRAVGDIAALLLLFSVTAVGAAAPDVIERKGLDPRIRTLLYSPTQVYRLRGWVGYHVDIEFESGESLVTLGGGDLDALTYGGYANHMVLKPKAPTVRTNLTVFTTRRTYIIEYTVSAGVPDPMADDLVYSLRFTYPAANSPTNTERVAAQFKGASAERTQNLDYWFCGHADLQPVAVSDDGVHTRLRFAPSAEMPAIFVRAEDGTESLLNYSVDAGDVVIHRLARHLILRRGKLVGCIVNKGYSGAGERLESGTVSPQVRRGTKGIVP